MSVKSKLKSLQQKLGARVTDDPDGVIAVLQSAKRLASTGVGVYTALDAAVGQASPKDGARAWWKAFHALTSANGGDLMFEKLTPEDLTAVFDKAIESQGVVNIAASKAKGRK